MGRRRYVPKLRPTAWLLRFIEEAYNARYTYELRQARVQQKERDKADADAAGNHGPIRARGDPKADDDGAAERVLNRLRAQTKPDKVNLGPIQFPTFIVDHISHQFGLKHITMQTCWDLVFNIEVHRDTYPEAELFSKFLGELYSTDDLLFFLYMRNLVQSHFGLQLHTRDKLAAVAVGAKRPPEQSVALVPHPLMENGTQVAYIPPAAARHALSTFLHDDLADFVCEQLLREGFSPDVEGFAGQPLMEAQEFLRAVLENYRKTPEELIRKMKYGESKQSTQQLKALQDTVRNANERAALAKALESQRLLLAEARIELAQLERDNGDGSKRTAVFLARNHVWKKEQDVADALKRVAAAEKAETEVWDTVMRASPAIVGGRRVDAAASKGGRGGASSRGKKRGRGKGGGSNPRAQKKARRFCDVDSVDLVVERFHLWLSEQFRRYRLQLKFLNAMQNTWKKRLDDLKTRAVLRIQRGFRERKAREAARVRAQAELERRREERERQRQANAALQKRREAEAAERKARLDAAAAVVEERRRRAEKKKRALARKKRKAWADIQHRKWAKHALRWRFVRWTTFVTLTKRQRKHRLKVKRHRFARWKGFTMLNKRRRDAAKAIQSIVRMHLAKRYVGRLRIVEKQMNARAAQCLRRFVFAAAARAFSKWAEYTARQQRVKRFMRRNLRGAKDRMFSKLRLHATTQRRAKTTAALFLQCRHRGHTARVRVTRMRVEAAAARGVTRFFRFVMARTILARLKRVREREEAIVSRFALRMKYRVAHAAWRAWAEYAYRQARAKRMFRAAVTGALHERLRRWRWWVEELHAAREFVAAAIQRNFHAKRALRATRHLLACHRAAARIQAIWRANTSARLVRRLLRHTRAARNIQRVFRGHLAREEVALLRLFNWAATAIQTAWRGKSARLLLRRLQIAALLDAAANKDFYTVQAAMARGDKWVTDDEGYNVLMRAATGGSKRIVKLAMRNNVDPNAYNYHGQTALHQVVRRRPAYAEQIPLLRYMIERGCNPELPDAEGNSVMTLAAQVGRSDIIEMLADKSLGLDLEFRDAYGMTALQKAAGFGFVPATVALLKSGADVNTRDNTGATPLHDACARGHMEVAKWLLYHDADRNAQDDDGFTPLAFAVTNKQVDIIPFLLAEGVEASLGNHTGRTPLHLAATANDPELVELVCRGEGELDLGDMEGDTAMHEAATLGYMGVLKTLLSYGANPNVQNGNSGDTPAHIAAERGQVAVIDMLIDYDADLNVKNYAGRNVLGVARMHNQRAVVALITQKFAVEVRPDEEQQAEVAELLADDHEAVIGTGGDRWEERYDEARGQPFWRNLRTQEVAWEDPAAAVKKVLRRRQEKQVGEGDVSVVDYKAMWEQTHAEIRYERRRNAAALLVQKIWRGRAVRRAMRLDIVRYRAAKDIQRIARGWLQRRRFRRLKWHTRKAVRIQAFWRGCLGRNKGARMRELVYYAQSCEWAVYHINRVYRGYRVRRRNRLRWWRNHGPHSFEAWAELRSRSKEVRKYNVWREMVADGTYDVLFYYNRYTGQTQWDKPRQWVQHDSVAARQAEEMKEKGYTTEMWNAACYMQAKWKGRQTRRRVAKMLQAASFYHDAERKYLRNPHSVPNKCNYMVYLICAPPHNYDRARPLVLSMVNFMTSRGPDNAFVLYAFAMYLCATVEEDWYTVEALFERARLADVKGNAFKKVEVGFYRQALVENPHDAGCCFNYALMKHWLHGDYREAEKFYLKAMRIDPQHKATQDNLNYMLSEHMGVDYTAFDAYRRLLEQEAQADYEHTTALQVYQQHLAAQKVQRIFRGARIRRIVKAARAAQAEEDGWYVACDDGEGGVYHYNQVSGESVWHRPDLGERLRTLAVLGVFDGCMGVLGAGGELVDGERLELPPGTPVDDDAAYERARAEAAVKVYDDPSDWEMCNDGQGNFYYYCVSSGVSQWDRPAFSRLRALALLGKSPEADDVRERIEEQAEAAAAEDGSVSGPATSRTGKTSRFTSRSLRSLGSVSRPPQSARSNPSVHSRGSGSAAQRYQAYTMQAAIGQSYQPDALEFESMFDAVKPPAGAADTGAGSGTATAGDGVATGAATAAAEPTDAEVSSAWEAAVDDDSGNTYWYNAVTGETTWVDPATAAAQAASPSEADGAWEECFDNSGNAYYYNAVTGVTTWDRPAALGPADAATAAATAAASSVDGASTGRDGAAASGEGGDDDAEWEEWENDDGLKYWFNTATQESVWERPSLAAKIRVMAAMGAFSQLAAQEQDASAGDQATPTVASEWEAAVDDDGNQYWYNATTGESSWFDPHAPAPDDAGAAATTAETAGGGDGDGDDDGDDGSVWEEAVDDATGATYFYNARSGESRWERPGLQAKVRAMGRASMLGARATTADNDAAATADVSTPAAEVWTEYATDDGIPYW